MSVVNNILRPASAIAVFVVLSVRFQPDASLALFAQVVGAITCAIVLSIGLFQVVDRIFYSSIGAAFKKPFIRREHKIIAKSALSFLVIQLLINASAQANILILSWIGSSDMVAKYFAISRAAQTVGFFHAAVLALYTPIVARLHGAGEVERRNVALLRAAKTSALLTSVAVLTAFLSAGYYLGAFGGEYKDATHDMRILLIICLVDCSLGPMSLALVATGLERRYAGSLVFGLLAGSLVSILLVPHLGIRGAVVGYGAQVLVVQLFLIPQVKRAIGFVPHPIRY